MTDERRSPRPWMLWLLSAATVLVAARFVLAAVSHALELASTVVVIVVVVALGWRLAVGDRRDRHRS